MLKGGGVRVVETYAGSAIEWAPQGHTWEGQFLYANSAGILAGPVAAAADAAGTTLELGSKLVGYAAEPGGGRQFLLLGTVVGATGGGVEICREQPGAPPVLVATVPLAGDGSFAAAAGDLGTGPALFRAVYRDALTGLPYGSLSRVPVSPRG